MIPKTEKCSSGWYVEMDWDYEGYSSWDGPFRSEMDALNWYWKAAGGA